MKMQFGLQGAYRFRGPLKRLIKEGWDNIPETMFGGVMALIGLYLQFFLCSPH